MSAASGYRDNAVGALVMAASMAAFTINDAFMKALSGDLPFFQALFLRSLLSAAALGMIAGARGFGWRRFARGDWHLVALRTLSETAAAYFFISALFHMPLANITAIIQTLPLTVTLAGVLFLGEGVGWRRMAAIAFGGLGMLLILRPGPDGFDTYAIYGVLAVVCVTVRDIAARRLGPAVPTLSVAFLTALSIGIFSGIGAGLTEWVPVSAGAAAKVVGAAVFIIGGYVFSIQAMRQGEIGFIAPFRYTSLVWALVLGLLVFGDWPDALTLLGAAIVVGSGLFALWREGRAARAAV